MSTVYELKNTIKMTAFLSRAVRNDERKATVERRKLLINKRMAEGGVPERARDRILRRVSGRFATNALRGRHDAPEPEWLVDAEAKRWNLHQQRAVLVRREARALYLAYGFLRGRAYNAIETHLVVFCTYEPPPWERVQGIITELTGSDVGGHMQSLLSWIDGTGWYWDDSDKEPERHRWRHAGNKRRTEGQQAKARGLGAKTA